MAFSAELRQANPGILPADFCAWDGGLPATLPADFDGFDSVAGTSAGSAQTRGTEAVPEDAESVTTAPIPPLLSDAESTKAGATEPPLFSAILARRRRWWR